MESFMNVSIPTSSVPFSRRTKLKFSSVDSAHMNFDREVLFKEIRSFIKKRYPNYKLEYGYLGSKLTGKEILESMMGTEVSLKYDQRLMQIDYCLIYRVPCTVPTVGDLAMIWCPSRFSSKSLNTMALYKKNGQLNEYLDDYFENNPSIPFKIVMAFLEQSDYGLTRKKFTFVKDPRTLERTSIENKNYWKNPENSTTVVKAIHSICAQFNPDAKR